jgi:hypothetical protein
MNCVYINISVSIVHSHAKRVVSAQVYTELLAPLACQGGRLLPLLFAIFVLHVVGAVHRWLVVGNALVDTVWPVFDLEVKWECGNLTHRLFELAVAYEAPRTYL